MHLVTCASPEYLARAGRPAKPGDLARHRCLVFRMPSSGRPQPWEFMLAGTPTVLPLESSVTMNDGEAMVAAVCAHLGVAQVPDVMAADALRAGLLVELLKPYRPPPVPISLVYASSRLVPPRLRVLIEALAPRRG
jgi:LysR family transcriptional regulator, regulator for bpeEF and oprC